MDARVSLLTSHKSSVAPRASPPFHTSSLDSAYNTHDCISPSSLHTWPGARDRLEGQATSNAQPVIGAVTTLAMAPGMKKYETAMHSTQQMIWQQQICSVRQFLGPRNW